MSSLSDLEAFRPALEGLEMSGMRLFLKVHEIIC